MVRLDERLSAIAELVIEVTKGRAAPCAADIGCDHGQLTAYLLGRCPHLFMIASDVSAPSLEKAKKLLAAHGLSDRARVTVADGLAGVDRPVDAIVIAGMGAETILKIITEGKEKIGGAALIVQSNVDLPFLRSALALEGFRAEKEVFSHAAGRRYVTMLVRAAEAGSLDEREALLGTAACGMQDDGQRAFFAWQRDVRVREMEKVAALPSQKAKARMEKNSRELAMISEAMSMQGCTAADIERLVGEIAPYALAEQWDNVGLLAGRRGTKVTRVLTALDLTDGVIDEAQALGAQVIVTHHPVMMDARRRLTDEDREGRLLLRLAECGMALIAAHTNFDSAPGGVNDTLMMLMGAEDVQGEACLRVGNLPEGTTFGRLCERAQQKLHGAIRAYGAADTVVTRLGCCSGAGGGFFAEAKAQGADCFITGEIKHHVALDAMDAGVCVIEAGHFETENPACEVMAKGLQNACDALKYNVTVFCSKGNPFGR
ncbi:MAG: Nif3-like dinuclear metal center hexameric protein [Clostridia bacterium]|nr:Nif3-like dinuclear metal center hexameric protein [Clostridia bacterium]